MFSKDHLREFKNAPWTTAEEMSAYVADVGRLHPEDVERLLDMLLDRKLVAQGHMHLNRCAVFAAIAPQALDQALFGPFVRALEKADDEVRGMLVPLIPRTNNVEQHDLLCRYLGSEVVPLRNLAADLLRQIGGPSALGHLTQMVRGRHFAGRTEAMDVMLPKARHRALPLLQAVLEAGSPRERAVALRHLSDPEYVSGAVEQAASIVHDALDDSDRRVAGEAVKAYGRLVTEERFFYELEHRLYAPDVDPALVQSLGSYSSERALAVLEHKIRVGPSTIRLAAIDALKDIGSDAIIPLLVDALQIDDVTVRKRATEVLSELSVEGKIDLARTVLELLRSKSTEVRRIAAHLARSVGDQEGQVTDQLLAYLRDEDWWVRERVLDALAEMSGPDLTPHIVGYLSDPSPVIRRYAIGGLIRLRDPGALGAILRAAVEDEDWWVREQCVQATAELGDPRAVPYLKKLALDRPDLRIPAIEALRALAAHDVIVELGELGADDDANVRLVVLKALGEAPRGREAALYVQACLTDRDARVAKRARELMQTWEMPLEKESVVAAMGLLDRLLVAGVHAKADDIVLEADRPPYIKRLGAMSAISKGVLSNAELESMLFPLLNRFQREALDGGKDVDFSYHVKSYDLRFRVNLFRQLTGTAAVFRHVKQQLQEMAELGLPDIVSTFGDYANGLVLFGGPTGAGKSTSLAALIDYINRTSSRHIITIEDPVEVIHPQRECLINQREIGTHARSFGRALRSALRQDPDVILVGELRDLETIDFAVNAAETGHIVLGTVHTVSADASIDRMVHAFPARQQGLIRSMLAESLKAVVCQQLLGRTDRSDRRILAAEVLLVNDAVKNLIRNNKSFQIPSVIATHREQGMQSMDLELERLVRAGLVEPEEALMKSVDKNAFASMLEAAGYLEARDDRGSLPPGLRHSYPPLTSPLVPPAAVVPSVSPGSGMPPGATMPARPSPLLSQPSPVTPPGSRVPPGVSGAVPAGGSGRTFRPPRTESTGSGGGTKSE